MSRRQPKAATMTLLLALALAMVGWMFSAPPEAAAALAPTQTAWWQVVNQAGAAAPAPPGVDTSKHDLYVQGAGGANGSGGLPAPPAAPPPPSNAQGGAQALAAIHYVIPDGVAVQKLTLTLSGNNPPSVTVVACGITDPSFKSEDNGPASDIPKYDCTIQSAGVLNAAGALEFADIGKLTKGPNLQVMLVPGQLDRVVFEAPSAASLQVSAGAAAAPAAAAQFPAQSAPVPAGDAGASAGGSVTTGGDFSASSVAAAPVDGPPLPAPLPASGPAGGLGKRILQVARPGTIGPRLPLSPQQTRLVVGAATLLAIAAFAAMVFLGPRMSALGLGPSTDALAARGIGRFARPRTGSAPKIW